MSEHPLEKWQFLAAIANSPPLCVSSRFNPCHAELGYFDLLHLMRTDDTHPKITRAIVFVLGFLEQFMALDGGQQQQILQILRREGKKP